MMSTVGSLGALLLWGIDEGLTQIDKCATLEFASWESDEICYWLAKSIDIKDRHII